MDITHPFGGLIAGRRMMLERKAFDCLAALSKQAVSERQLLHPKPPDDDKPYSAYLGIAVIPVHGALSKRAGFFDAFFGLTSYEVLEETLERALHDPDISGILLDIDSPGGEVSGLFDLADFIYASREIKPIWACANDDAYSAAYAIASSAEKIFVTRTGGVGSIGVIATHIDQSSFDEKLGVKYTTIFAGDRKNDFTPHAELTNEASKLLQKEVDRLYGLFTSLVSRNRGLSDAQVRNTEAGLFFGENALSAGLADQIMTLPDALDLMTLELQPKPKRTIMTDPNTQTQNQAPQASAEVEAPETQEQETEQVTETESQPEQTDGGDENVTETPAAEEEAPAESEDAGETEGEASDAEEDVEAKVRKSVKAEIAELSKACDVAGMPEKLGEFIEKGYSAEQAKDELMKLMANSDEKTEIHSQTTPAASAENEQNPVVETAKARAEAAQQ